MTHEDLLARLDALGQDNEAVAETLRSRGIKGVPGEDHICPVANYLREVLPKGAVITVDGSSVTAADQEGPRTVTTPGPVAHFIECFDNGEFADLQATTLDDRLKIGGGNP